MKFISSLKSALGLAGLLGALLGANVARADVYTIDLDTSALVNHASGPFYLDFQSIFGSGSDQTITLTNFVLTGGGFVGGTEWAVGAITGSLASSLVINPGSASFYNEFFQQFEAGVSEIKFDVDITPNPAGVTPTSFAVSILDNANLYAIPTTGFADTLVFFNLDGAATTVETAVSTGDTAGVRAHVPETGSTVAFVLVAVSALGAFQGLRRKTDLLSA